MTAACRSCSRARTANELLLASGASAEEDGHKGTASAASCSFLRPKDGINFIQSCFPTPRAAPIRLLVGVAVQDNVSLYHLSTYRSTRWRLAGGVASVPMGKMYNLFSSFPIIK